MDLWLTVTTLWHHADRLNMRNERCRTFESPTRALAGMTTQPLPVVSGERIKLRQILEQCRKVKRVGTRNDMYHVLLPY
jgi:hypothetical protein